MRKDRKGRGREKGRGKGGKRISGKERSINGRKKKKMESKV